MLKTKHKIALAKMARSAVSAMRAIQGAGMTGNFRRGGMKWHLDLNEGIDFSIFLLGAFEPSTVRFYRKVLRPGDIVLDIGANIGAHTLPFAQCVGPDGRVYAFEPTEFAYNKLIENLTLNPELNRVVTPNHMLLKPPGDWPAPSEIYSSWPLDPVGEVHEKHLGQLRPLGAVAMDTVDSYCAAKGITRVDWIKIDVDGNETTVLRGSTGTLRDMRPKMIIELSPYVCREAGHRFDELVDLLRGAGYDFYDLESGRELPSRADDLDAIIPDGGSLNAFLKPMARVDAPHGRTSMRSAVRS